MSKLTGDKILSRVSATGGQQDDGARRAVGRQVSHIVGFDLSLTAPAAVAIPVDWKPGDWKRVKSWLLKPLSPKSDDLAGQFKRYKVILSWIEGIISGSIFIGAAFIEQYAFSRNNSQASKLMELGGCARLKMYDRCLVPVTVNTSQARKLMLGKVPKGDQKLAVQRYLFDAGAPKDWEENICDACCVANYGLSECGGTALVTG